MTSFKEESQAYEPKITLNIADLERVDLSFPMENRSGVDKDGKEFFYKVLVVNGLEYRTPNSVLEEVKKMLELKPDLKFVKVTQSGSGLNTRYKVSVSK